MPNSADARSLIIGLTDVSAGDEAEYNDWYETEHLPMIAGLDGSLRMRRYRRMDQPTPKYLILMEFDGLGPIDTPGYHAKFRHGAYPAGTPWTRRMRQKFDVKLRNVYTLRREVAEGPGLDEPLGSLMTLEMFAAPDPGGDAAEWYESRLHRLGGSDRSLKGQLFQALPEFLPAYLSVSRTVAGDSAGPGVLAEAVPDKGFKGVYQLISLHLGGAEPRRDLWQWAYSAR